MDRPELLTLWKQVFGDFDGFWETFLDCAYEEDHCLYSAEDGQIQAALYWFDCGAWAYLFAVATHPDHRGKGLCRSLMEKAHSRLQAMGYDGALLVPADAGLRQMYGKMGYREGTALRQLYQQAGETPVSLRQLTAQDYAQARNAYLPDGGLRQEGSTFTLLARTGVRFWEGEGCLLAGEGENILEYLGDETLLPGVLKTLGCPEASVRMPGTGLPFAMVHPFKEDIPLPTYFAFAFD